MGCLFACCIKRDDADIRPTAQPVEKFGSTNFDGLFEQMQKNSDKQIKVRESRRDPEGSHAAKFWIYE